MQISNYCCRSPLQKRLLSGAMLALSLTTASVAAETSEDMAALREANTKFIAERAAMPFTVAKDSEAEGLLTGLVQSLPGMAKVVTDMIAAKNCAFDLTEYLTPDAIQKVGVTPEYGYLMQLLYASEKPGVDNTARTEYDTVLYAYRMLNCGGQGLQELSSALGHTATAKLALQTAEVFMKANESQSGQDRSGDAK